MTAWSQQSGLANAAILAAFGQPVSYQQGAGVPFTVIGVLDKRSDEQRHPDTVYARLFVALSSFSVPPDHADEVAVEAFLEGRTTFMGIPRTIEKVLASTPEAHPATIAEVLAADRVARQMAHELLV